MRAVDFLVVGGGIAGLRAAVGLAEAGNVLVVTKEGLAESNTAYAQGGIAVAMDGEEDVALHLADTVAAGDGLVNAAAAAVLVEQGPRRVDELIAWGTGFDRYPAGVGAAGAGQLMRTREGAHSLARILHANGDATGREILVSLLRHLRGMARVELMEWATTVDLIVCSDDDGAGRVVGATLLDAAGGLREVRARAVLLASGGAGQVYSDTTNPAVATGDGIAMAYRAGAELMDMEFYQFHPTAFAMDGAPRFLMSESLRGEGAWLVNERGERFMQRYHAGMELAPRDVVARAIGREGMGGRLSRHARGGKELRSQGAVSRNLWVSGGVWAGIGEGPDSGAAGGALFDGRHPNGRAWAKFAGGPVRGGRGGLHGSAWGEPAGQQLAAGGAGLRGAGGRGDGWGQGSRFGVRGSRKDNCGGWS